MRHFDLEISKIKFISCINEFINDNLFTGMNELYFISYVASLKELLRLFERYNFNKITGIIGRSVTNDFKSELNKDEKMLEEIIKKFKTKQWVLHILKEGKVTIHDKFYLLKNEEINRIIMGSANLTSNGFYNKKQQNILCVMDLPISKNGNLFIDEDEKKLKQFYEYFESRKEDCEPFMENLLNNLDKLKIMTKC